MRKIVTLPRILKINRIDELTISVVFNNGESRLIDFVEVFKSLKLPKDANARILLNPTEFRKVKLENHTLSWARGGEVTKFQGKERKVPFEIGADILYKWSKPDFQAPTLAIGRKLKDIREKEGLSQDELARRSGTSRNYISRIENDRSGIELSTLEKIVVTGLGKKLEITIK